jgi:hypothetical protein
MRSSSKVRKRLSSAGGGGLGRIRGVRGLNMGLSMRGGRCEEGWLRTRSWIA